MGNFNRKPTICRQRNENKELQERLNTYIFSNNYRSYDIFQNVDNQNIIRIRNIDFTFGKRLGSGSNGRVYNLVSPEVSLAIKFGSSNDEVQIAQELNNKIPPCNCLKVQSVGKELYNPKEKQIERHGYFMELAEGTLDEFLDIIPNIDTELKTDQEKLRDTLLQIAEKIRVQMLCIYNMNNDYVYTDMKLANVLYKCRNKDDLNSVSFILADLGSAVPYNGQYLATYPPVEYRMGQGFFNLNTPQAKAFFMGYVSLPT